MMRTLWERIRRYLLLWLIILVVLCVVSLVIYWDVLMNYLSSMAMGIISGIAMVAMIIGGIIYLISRR